MVNNEKAFRELVERLISPHFGTVFDPLLLHGLMGMASEAGEILNNYKKWMAYSGEQYDRTDMLIEMSDLLHFMEYVLIAQNSSIEELRDINIAKLTTRYSEGFTAEEGATHGRDKKAERAAVDKVVAEYVELRSGKSGSIPFGKEGRIDNN